MKKLQVIIIVLFISLTICTLANFQVKAQSATIGTAGKMQSNWVFMAQNMEPRWLKQFEPSLKCTATINPTTANAGETKTYVIQIVNLQKAPHGYSGGTLKCANITIPSGFSSVTVTSAKCYDSNGNLKTTWNYGADASQIWVWGGNQRGDDATQGQYVNVTFSAKAPTSLGTYTWTTYVYKHAPSSSRFIWPTICNSLGAVYGSQPTVTVSTAVGAATHLVVSSGISQVAGTPFTLTVTAVDAYGNTATGYSGTVHLSSSDSGSGVSLPSNYAFHAGDNGVKSFSVTLVTIGSQSVTATDTVTGSITGSQNSIMVNVGSLYHISVSPSAPSVTAGGQQAFVSTAYDQFNNLIGTVTSSTTWSIQSGAGGSWVQSTGTYTSQYSGSWTVTAVYSGKTATATLTVNVGTLASVSVSGPGSVTAGGAATFTATGFDASGNSLGVQTASWSIDAGAAGSWSSNVYTSHTAGSWTVTATVSGHTGTASLTVNAGAATHLVVLSGTSQVAGTPFTVTVTAEDAHGNTAAAYSGTVHFTSSDGQAVLPANSVLSSGTGTFSVTLKTAGSQSITATDTVTSSITGSESGITVTHAAAASSVVVISPVGASVTAGASKTYSAMATDAYGNNWNVTGSVSWSISSGAGGSWSSNVYTSETAGTWTVTADNGAGVTGTASLMVIHGSAVSITISPITQTVSAGASQTYSATATDLCGNTWDVTGSVTWSIDSGAGGFWSGATYTSANAGSWTVKAALGGISDTASLRVNAVTYEITVTSAYGNPTASASVNAGDSFTASVTSPESAGVGQQWICTGYSIDGRLVVSGTSYTFTNVQSNHTITFNWQKQYYLTTSTNFGSVVPVSGWYVAGSTVTLSATAPTAGSGEQYVWNGWTGTGTGSYSGTGNNSALVTMNGPIAETASWTHQYQLTVTSAYGSPSGQGWYTAGSQATFGVTTPVSGGTGVQYVFAAWSGDSSSKSASNSILMNAPKTVTATWTTQYQVTYVASGNANPVSVPASEWVISGNAATEYFPAGATVGGVMDTFLSDNRPASITKPTTITGLYQTSYYLTVSSAHGSPIGQGWYNAGVTADAGLASGTVSGGAGTQYVFTSWSGDASGSAFSSSNAITMNGPKTATANWKTQYQVTFAVSGGGSASPTGSNVWENAGSLPITATPNSGYTFSSWSSNTGSITFNNANSASSTATISGTGTITATFAINTYGVTVNVGAHGSSNLASQTVNWNTQLNFVFTPDTGYSVSVVAVNGTSAGAATSLSLTITGDTIVDVSFAINTYTITVNQTANGVISPGTSSANYGATASFSITPNTGYYIASITVDGSSVAITSSSGQTVSFTNVQAAHTITANFAIETFVLTVTQGDHGTIAPDTSTVNYGATQTFTITPDTGYHIASLTVDGSPVAVASSYTFSNIQAPHTISATFAITSTTPTASPSSPTPTASPSSPRPTASPSSPTPTVSPLSPTPTGSSPSPTPTVSPPSPTPLYLVLAAVIIAAAIIISVIAIKRSRRKPDNTLPNPENKYKKINVLAANEKQEIASLKGTIEKIKNLETEKKNLLLEIEELKKMADAKATALESEVGTLWDKAKSQKILMHGSKPSVDQRLKKNYKNKTF